MFKHSIDFGITGNWNKTMSSQFENIVRNHINSFKPIVGTYRGTQKVLHYFNPKTGLNVMTDFEGNLIGGWKLGTQQIKYLLETGAVK